MERMLLQQTVRAVLALCQLAAACDADDVRADVIDEAAVLIDVTLGAPSDGRSESVAAWCRRTGEWLDRLRSVGGVDEPALLRAQARILRLQTVTDEQPPKKAKTHAQPRTKQPEPVIVSQPTAGQAHILEWLRANPGARNRDLVAQFAAEMSPRTVKRSLNKLVTMGAVLRSRTETNGVVYEVAER